MRKIFLGGLIIAAAITLSSCVKSQTLSPEQAKVTAQNFINSGLVPKDNPVTVSEVTEDNGLYKLNVQFTDGRSIISYMTMDGKKFFAEAMDIPVEPPQAQPGETTATDTEANSAAATSGAPTDDTGQRPTTIAGVTTFSDSGDPICKKDGKPIVYLFSTTWCPHCQWIKNTFDSTVKEYADAGKIKAYHWEVDTNDNTLTVEAETQVPAEHTAVYKKFNPEGSIPTFVFGCKYYRIGNGYEAEDNLEAEQAEFRAVIDSIIQ